jgi:hypothetical protein
VGQLFFEEIITTQNYLSLLTQFIALLEENVRDCRFQQDGANTLTAETRTAFLQDFFGDRIVTCGLWPPESPDLTPSEFIL